VRPGRGSDAQRETQQSYDAALHLTASRKSVWRFLLRLWL
jgi:hypothetical protein